MLKDKISEKDKKRSRKSGKKIIRICDECGKEDELKLYNYINCHKYRKLRGDFCTSCSMKAYFKQNPQPIGKNSKSWRGGIRNGYQHISIRDADGKVKHIGEHRYIYSNFLNREILSSESIHHIDMDKLNNGIENLHLYESEKQHQLSHRFLEKSILGLLGNKLWFDAESCVYSLNTVKNVYSCSFPIEIEYELKYRKCSTATYAYIYLPKEKKQKLLHAFIAEKILGRKLYRDECVHHIDGNTLNNEVINFRVMTLREHELCHVSLRDCATELYKQGLVGFDRENGKYFIVGD